MVEPANNLDGDLREDLQDAPEYEPRLVNTQPNEYGVYRQYIGTLPSYTPDEIASLADLCNSPNLLQPTENADTDKWWTSYARSAQNVSSDNYYAPFPNASTFHLMHWHQSGSNQKSNAELKRLVKDVILAPDFRPQDLEKFSVDREVHRLESHQNDQSPIFSAKDGWNSCSVRINVPCERVKHASEKTAPVFKVQKLHYRNIVDVVKSALSESSAARHHVSPFREYFQPSPDSPPERIYSEIYNSDALIEEHEKIKAQPRNCNLEAYVIPILLWSDSTHLTSFGNASLWPMYLFLGSLTKYTRCKPTSFSAHHIAYMPKVRLLPSFHSPYLLLFSLATNSKIGTSKHSISPRLWP